jgi:hypothetical protein
MDDPARRQAAGIPAERRFATKGELATQMVARCVDTGGGIRRADELIFSLPQSPGPPRTDHHGSGDLGVRPGHHAPAGTGFGERAVDAGALSVPIRHR